jgi:wobble nucleotide-excising tRNase
MELKAVKKIKYTGVLQKLDSSNLPSPDSDFKKINLIFGWNGTGKTTLSRIFRSYELGEKCKRLDKYEACEVELEFSDGKKLKETDFSSKQNIRVFNKDFVEENIFRDEDMDGGSVMPIYYLGSEKIELTQERRSRKEKQGKFDDAKDYVDKKEKEIDKYEQQSAKSIKDTLLGVKSFQNYDKNNFSLAIKKMEEKVVTNKAKVSDLKINEDIFEQKLKNVKNFESLQEWVEDIKSKAQKVDESFLDNLNAGCLSKIVTIQQTIEKLKDDWRLSSWVQEGLKIHKERESDLCEFCLQDLSEERLANLDKHFNKEYIALIELVENKLTELKDLKIKEVSKIPNDDTKELATKLNQEIETLVSRLHRKKTDILSDHSFTEEEIKTFTQIFAGVSTGADSILEKISNTAEELEFSLLSDRYSKYRLLLKELNDKRQEKVDLSEEVLGLDQRIKDGEKEVRDFKVPADLINKGLKQFLGHKELSFKDKTDEYGETFYEIYRNKDLAFNLSEGEKTAISLIYFLKKLDEDGFDKANGIIFIDDPISSLDSQFLYTAYAFVVSAIEEDRGSSLKIGQTIISTHNFDFFNLFKKKYYTTKQKTNADGTPKPRRCNLFMMRVESCEEERCSNLFPLDNLLKNNDSDYQYLYRLLVDFDNASGEEKDQLERIYPYPNVARRVLESFLSFKYPSQPNLQAKIDIINHEDIAKEIKESVYRFINIKSHGTMKEIEGFAPEIIDPSAKDQISNVLYIMKRLDKDHCEGLEV